MNLENLVRRYENDFNFRFKSKFKNFVKRTKPYRLILGIPLWFALSGVYHTNLRKEFSEYRELIRDRKKRIESISKIIDNENINPKLKLETENYIKEELEEYNSDLRSYYEYRIDPEAYNYLFNILFYGILGFYLVNDVLRVKKISHDKSNYSLLGIYALSRLAVTNNILDMESDYALRMGISSLNELIILSSLNSLSNILYNNFSKPGIINGPKSVYKYIKGLIKKDEELIEQSYDYLKKDKLEKKLSTVELFFVKPKSENIKYVKDSIEKIISGKGLTQNYDMKSLTYNTNSFLFNFLSGNIKDLAVRNTIQFNHYFTNGNYTKAFQKLKRIKEHSEYSYDFSIVYALMLNKFVNNLKNDCSEYDAKGVIDFLKKHDDLDSFIDKTWGRTLEVLLRDEKTKFENISGNNIKCIATSEFLKNALALKENSRKSLEQEFSNSLFIKYLIYDSEEFDVINSLKVVDFNDKSYLISEFKEGPTLMNIKDLETFVKASKFLKLIHTRLDSKKSKRDYKTEVESRILTYDLDLINIIRSESWKEIWNCISEQNSFYDADPHGEQYIVNEKITRLDLDDKGIIEWPFQLNKLAIQSGLKGNNYEAIVNAYCDGYKLWDSCKCFLMASIPSALSYISRTIVDENGNDKQRKIYLDFALNSCSELGFDDLKEMIMKI
ncbi:hypothetical protein KY334_01195 [Candidatus Woesearchaeota archaeon]|nr:hypothetical protein [Candidatus Woesearchaeota archaeon]